MGLARYIGRAGALALALGVAIAMSAEPLVAHATRGERDGLKTEFVQNGVGVLVVRHAFAGEPGRTVETRTRSG